MMGRKSKRFQPVPLDIWAPKTSRQQDGRADDGGVNLDLANSSLEDSSDSSRPTDSRLPSREAPNRKPIRGTMNPFPSTQQTRQPPRLQNTQKSALGNGLTGWSSGGGGFGLGGGLGAGLGGAGVSSRQHQLSGFAQVMGGGSGQGPIDMSDFPSLSGGPRAAANTTAAGWNSNAIRQQSQQQQAQAQQTQRPASTAPSQQSIDQFDGQRSQQPSIDRSEDPFPPLGGQLNGDSLPGGQSNGFGSSLTSPDSATQPRATNGQQNQLPIRPSADSTFSSQALQAPIGSGQPSQQQQQQQPQQPALNGQTAPPATITRYAEMTEQEKYGMAGIAAGFEARRAIETGAPVDETLPPAMRNGVFLGQELGTLGLDLDNPEPMYTTFTPFPSERASGGLLDFHERHVVPDFQLPAAYTVGNVPGLQGRMGAFSDETLFSIFYQFPRDILQEVAAIELTGRDWRWHKILRQWLQKDTRESSSSSALQILDLAPTQPIGAAPVRVAERTERGVYVFFDANNWRRERREFVLDYTELDHRNVPGAIGGAQGLGAVGMGAGVGGGGMSNGVGVGGGGGGGAIGPAPGMGGVGVGAGGPVQPPNGGAGGGAQAA